PSGDGSVAAAEQGEQLSKTDAAALESALKTTPGDLKAREKLVGYYFIAQAVDLPVSGKIADLNAATVARDRHLLWLIENSPALELLGTSPVGVVQPTPDPAGYSAAEAAWTRQVGNQPVARVQGNAGIFFAQTNDPRAIQLLKAAETGDSQNPGWPAALGDMYVAQARSSPLDSATGRQAASSAVGELEKAWNLSGSATTDPTLSQIAKLSVVAGLDDKAVQYATVLLNTFKSGSGQSPL